MEVLHRTDLDFACEPDNDLWQWCKCLHDIWPDWDLLDIDRDGKCSALTSLAKNYHTLGLEALVVEAEA